VDANLLAVDIEILASQEQKEIGTWLL